MMADEADEDPRVARPARFAANLQTYERITQVHNIAVETAIRVEAIGIRLDQQFKDAREDTLRINALDKEVSVMKATTSSERNTLAWVWNVACAIGGAALMFATTYFTTKH